MDTNSQVSEWLYMIMTCGWYAMSRVLSTGGKLPPPPPQWFANDSTYHNIERLAFLNSIMPALITQELKFSLFKVQSCHKMLQFSCFV